MHFIYKFEQFDYVSQYQNYLAYIMGEEVFRSDYDNRNLSFGLGSIREDQFCDLLDITKQSERENEYLLWDTRYFEHNPIHALGRFSELVGSNKYKAIIIVCDSKDFADLTTFELKKKEGSEIYCTLYEDSLVVYYGLKSVRDKVISCIKPSQIKEIIQNETSRYLFYELKDGLSETERVHSSNIYANHYINVRKIFCNSRSFSLAVYNMALLIKREKNAFDALLCASVNGACLASALSVLFNKPVIHLRNVGPYMAVSDDKMIERIIAGKKYVFVFDFMCLGTEYHRIKMICNIRHAEIHRCIGISHYKFPSAGEMNSEKEEQRILSLFNINSFENYYKCFVDQKDCINYIRYKKYRARRVRK